MASAAALMGFTVQHGYHGCVRQSIQRPHLQCMTPLLHAVHNS